MSRERRVFCFSSPRLGARPPFARDAPLPLNPLFVFVGDGGMKGWRHLRVDQQIPPREKNETGVYDGRHIFSPWRIRSPSRLSPGAPPPLFRKKNSPPTPAPAASFPSRRRRTAVETVGGTRPFFRSRCKILIRSVVFLCRRGAFGSVPSKRASRERVVFTSFSHTSRHHRR